MSRTSKIMNMMKDDIKLGSTGELKNKMYDYDSRQFIESTKGVVVGVSETSPDILVKFENGIPSKLNITKMTEDNLKSFKTKETIDKAMSYFTIRTTRSKVSLLR